MATATVEKTLKLPDLLRSHHDEFIAALAKPLLMEWDDEGPAYCKAPQPAAIGNVLVDALHDELVNAEIGYVAITYLTQSVGGLNVIPSC